jgi:site-specific recombinase XerD
MNAHIQEFLNYLTAERGSSGNTVSAYHNLTSSWPGGISRTGLTSRATT